MLVTYEISKKIVDLARTLDWDLEVFKSIASTKIDLDLNEETLLKDANTNKEYITIPLNKFEGREENWEIQMPIDMLNVYKEEKRYMSSLAKKMQERKKMKELKFLLKGLGKRNGE